MSNEQMLKDIVDLTSVVTNAAGRMQKLGIITAEKDAEILRMAQILTTAVANNDIMTMVRASAALTNLGKGILEGASSPAGREQGIQ